MREVFRHEGRYPSRGDILPGRKCYLQSQDKVLGLLHRYSYRWIHDNVMIWKHFAILGLCGGNPPTCGGFPSQKAMIQSFDDFLVAGMDKLLNKQSSYRWYETPWRPCEVMLSQRTHDVMKTSLLRRRFDVIMTLLLRHVSACYTHVWALFRCSYIISIVVIYWPVFTLCACASEVILKNIGIFWWHHTTRKLETCACF